MSPSCWPNLGWRSAPTPSSGRALVDAALALKAEERRRLFEEAAGIGLYRTRREEALRRLETTRRNLDRVQDILAELQPRLRSLERQARRAGEYEQVRADLQVLLREWYGYHWHHAQQELGEARDFARVQENQLARARKALGELDEKLAASRAQVQGVRAASTRGIASLPSSTPARRAWVASWQWRMSAAAPWRHNRSTCKVSRHAWRRSLPSSPSDWL